MMCLNNGANVYGVLKRVKDIPEEFIFQDGNGKLDYDEFVKMMLRY